MSGELGRDGGEDGFEPREDAATGGRGGHAALGHHRDRRTEPEQLTAIAPYSRVDIPLGVSFQFPSNSAIEKPFGSLCSP
ncbi:hypothetical protein [Streptomyces sp. NPDC049915]|uniref:hypothetical protein n=1 Tax=Streptomyces sp. NPDC049915 TaxID=3155510 RepID=UPI0034184BE7